MFGPSTGHALVCLNEKESSTLLLLLCSQVRPHKEAASRLGLWKHISAWGAPVLLAGLLLPGLET